MSATGEPPPPGPSPSSRQWPAFTRVIATVEDDPALEGALLIGSLATGAGDDMSDVDLFVIARDGAFADAWSRRCELHDDVVGHWDHRDPDMPAAGAHKFLTRDLVLVECLIAEPASGVRLAEPNAVVAGPADLAERIPSRPPIERAEMTGGHPIEDASDALKAAIRGLG